MHCFKTKTIGRHEQWMINNNSLNGTNTYTAFVLENQLHICDFSSRVFNERQLKSNQLLILCEHKESACVDSADTNRNIDFSISIQMAAMSALIVL